MPETAVPVVPVVRWYRWYRWYPWCLSSRSCRCERVLDRHWALYSTVRLRELLGDTGNSQGLDEDLGMRRITARIPMLEAAQCQRRLQLHQLGNGLWRAASGSPASTCAIAIVRNVEAWNSVGAQ